MAAADHLELAVGEQASCVADGMKLDLELAFEGHVDTAAPHAPHSAHANEALGHAHAPHHVALHAKGAEVKGVAVGGAVADDRR